MADRRHLAGVEGAAEFGDPLSLPGAFGFRALETSGCFVLEGREDLIAPSGFLLMFLIVVQPKGGISAEKHEQNLSCPMSQPRKE